MRISPLVSQPRSLIRVSGLNLLSLGVRRHQDKAGASAPVRYRSAQGTLLPLTLARDFCYGGIARITPGSSPKPEFQRGRLVQGRLLKFRVTISRKCVNSADTLWCKCGKHNRLMSKVKVTLEP